MSTSHTTIYLIRHGEIDNPRKVFYGRILDLHLNEEGRSRIRKLAQKLKNDNTKIHSIYTSPLARSVESAQIIAEIFDNVPILEEKDLTEVDIPALVGHSASERGEIHAKGIDEYSGKFVERGNESRKQIAERMLRVFHKIRKQNKGKVIVAVSHGDPIRFLLFRLESLDKPIPSMSELKNSDYLKRGEGWRLVVDEEGSISERKLIHV